MERVEVKTDAELATILTQQRKLLSNRKFVDKLPDKGEKIKNLIGRIEHEQERRTRCPRVDEMLSKLSVNEQKSEMMTAAEAELIKTLMAANITEKQITVENIQPTLQNSPNSYLQVLQRSNKVPPRQRFVPNRTRSTNASVADHKSVSCQHSSAEQHRSVSTESVHSALKNNNSSTVTSQDSEDYKTMNVDPSDTLDSLKTNKVKVEQQNNLSENPPIHRLKYRYDECLETDKTRRRCSGSKLLGLAETVEAFEKYKSQLKDTGKTQASGMLSDKYQIFQDFLHPPQEDRFKYRDKAAAASELMEEESEDDSDDSDDEDIDELDSVD